MVNLKLFGADANSKYLQWIRIMDIVVEIVEMGTRYFVGKNAEVKCVPIQNSLRTCVD